MSEGEDSIDAVAPSSRRESERERERDRERERETERADNDVSARPHCGGGVHSHLRWRSTGWFSA